MEESTLSKILQYYSFVIDIKGMLYKNHFLTSLIFFVLFTTNNFHLVESGRMIRVVKVFGQSTVMFVSAFVLLKSTF